MSVTVAQVCGAVLGFVRTRDAELPPAPSPAQAEAAPDEAQGEHPSGAGLAAEGAAQQHDASAAAAPLEGWDGNERALQHADANGASLEAMDTTGEALPVLREQREEQNGALVGGAAPAEEMQQDGLHDVLEQGHAAAAQGD